MALRGFLLSWFYRLSEQPSSLEPSKITAPRLGPPDFEESMEEKPGVLNVAVGDIDDHAIERAMSHVGKLSYRKRL